MIETQDCVKPTLYFEKYNNKENETTTTTLISKYVNKYF